MEWHDVNGKRVRVRDRCLTVQCPNWPDFVGREVIIVGPVPHSTYDSRWAVVDGVEVPAGYCDVVAMPSKHLMLLEGGDLLNDELAGEGELECLRK